ncbi:MAG: hypothetical protein GYB33_13795 [Gammaproteobacteria bacterium]|nr:hypothetical protein [Gammaproteobacteria bacterium]
MFLRDGLQGWPEVLSTDSKLQLLEAIDRSGVAEIDVTSFVPSHVVPQFADAVELLQAYRGQAEVRVLTVNQKGAQRLVEVHKEAGNITTCGMPFSASEAHNLANLRCDHATHKQRIADMVDILSSGGVKPMVCVATAWGCPIAGDISADQVLQHVDWLHGLGVRNIMLGDTTGMADPARVKSLFQQLVSQYRNVDFIAHFHDNRGAGVANVLAAIDAGVNCIDGCLGGIGGEPASVEQGEVGDSGNVVSEDLIALLERMGLNTGVNSEALMAAGKLAEKILGRRLFSKVQRSGLIRSLQSPLR